MDSIQNSSSTHKMPNAPYISPTPGEFPIIVSSLFPRFGGLVPNDYDFATAKECGINAFICAPAFNNLDSSTDNKGPIGQIGG